MHDMIDSHCHLDDDRYTGRLQQVLTNAHSKGITQFIVPATMRQRWSKLTALTNTYQTIHVAYGLHPCFMQYHQGFNIEMLEQVIDANPCVAVGECGLDFFHSNADADDQIQLFQQQLSVAKNHSLPIIVHSRKSLDKVISNIRKAKLEHGGVVHSFSGSLQQAKQLIDLGFKLGIAATVCYERAKKLRATIKAMPLQSFLLESDAPDQPGPLHRGQLNEPAFMIEQAQQIAKIKEMKVAEVIKQISRSTEIIFNIS